MYIVYVFTYETNIRLCIMFYFVFLEAGIHICTTRMNMNIRRLRVFGAFGNLVADALVWQSFVKHSARRFWCTDYSMRFADLAVYLRGDGVSLWRIQSNEFACRLPSVYKTDSTNNGSRTPQR